MELAQGTWVERREENLRPWVKKILRFLGTRSAATSYSRVDHFLILSEKGHWASRERVVEKLQDLSEFVGFEVRCSDYVFDVAERVREAQYNVSL